MKTVKIASIVASSIIFLLITLALNLEDPLKANYRNTVNKMMEMEKVNSEKKVLSKNPTLKKAKKNIAKADQLKTQICAKTSSIAPSLTKAEEIELEKMQKELQELRQNAEQLLISLQSGFKSIAVTP